VNHKTLCPRMHSPGFLAGRTPDSGPPRRSPVQTPNSDGLMPCRYSVSLWCRSSEALVFFW